MTEHAKMEVEMIDDAKALKAFLDGLPPNDTKPNLYVDLEGNNLSRNGTLSLVTMLVEPRHTVHLIDVHILGKDAFTTANTNGATLKQILEFNSITKVFFDIRNDSDALFHLHGIRVAGIEDLQLMELGSRSNKRLVNGLGKCIDKDAPISPAEREAWKSAKESSSTLPAVVASPCLISVHCQPRWSSTACKTSSTCRSYVRSATAC